MKLKSGVLWVSVNLTSIYERIEFIMKVTVCIGSSCHIKGSRQVVENLQNLINENNLSDKVELSGTFCLGKCQQGVCVNVDEEFHSVTPANVKEFFEKEILSAIK